MLDNKIKRFLHDRRQILLADNIGRLCRLSDIALTLFCLAAVCTGFSVAVCTGLSMAVCTGLSVAVWRFLRGSRVWCELWDLPVTYCLVVIWLCCVLSPDHGCCISSRLWWDLLPWYMVFSKYVLLLLFLLLLLPVCVRVSMARPIWTLLVSLELIMAYQNEAYRLLMFFLLLLLLLLAASRGAPIIGR